MVLIFKVKFVFLKSCLWKEWDQADFIVELEVKMSTSET